MRDTLFFAYEYTQRAVRDRKHKLVEYNIKGKRTTNLFDLESDPLELKNLAKDRKHQDTVKKLRKELIRYRDEWDDMKSPFGEIFWKEYDE